MPIPAKFDKEMIKIENRFEEIANNVLMRIYFLFEVKPNIDYLQEVSQQLQMKQVDSQSSGLKEIMFAEDPEN